MQNSADMSPNANTEAYWQVIYSEQFHSNSLPSKCTYRVRILQIAFDFL